MTINRNYESVKSDGSIGNVIFDSEYHEADLEPLMLGNSRSTNVVSRILTLISISLIVSVSFLCIQYFGSSMTHQTNFSTNPDQMYLESSSNVFTLSSSAFPANGTLPDMYTCKVGDELGVSPPLDWINAPAGTIDFAVAMKKKTGYSWCVYDIQSSISELLANSTDVGITGGTVEFDSSDKNVTRYDYDEPCAKGPGVAEYTFQVFAFSRSVSSALLSMGISKKSTNPVVILDVMGDSLLGVASLPCYFTLYDV